MHFEKKIILIRTTKKYWRRFNKSWSNKTAKKNYFIYGHVLSSLITAEDVEDADVGLIVGVVVAIVVVLAIAIAIAIFAVRRRRSQYVYTYSHV